MVWRVAVALDAARLVVVVKFTRIVAGSAMN